MAFREKTAWISILVTLGIYGFYFAALVPALGRGDADGLQFFGLLMKSMMTYVAVFVILSIVAAVLASKDANAPADEREKLIGLKAIRIAYYAVATGAVAAMGAAFLGVTGFWTANLLFLSLVAADLLKNATEIALHRIGV